MGLVCCPQEVPASSCVRGLQRVVHLAVEVRVGGLQLASSFWAWSDVWDVPHPPCPRLGSLDEGVREGSRCAARCGSPK